MALIKDPVCGMEIDTNQAPETATYQGATYHFCSPMCKTKFTMNPAKYTGVQPGGDSHGGHHHNHHSHN